MYSLTVHLNGNNGALLLNGTLPVEIFHREWHFISRNFQWEMAFTNGNFPCLTVHFNGNNDTLLLNAILPVEIFHRKCHFTSGNYCIYPSFGKLDCFYCLRHIISIFPVEIWQNSRWLW